MMVPAFVLAGLPGPWRALITVALAIVVVMLAWTLVLFVRARRALIHAPEPVAGATDRFLWVFLVPALNEELTIADSVTRLLAIPVTRRRIVVIDDASDDATAEVLRGFSDPDLEVIRRELPDARAGKAAALNHAYLHLTASLGAHVDRGEVIVVIVDADGRLDPAAPAYAAAHFAEPSVGGLQSLVRIYDRSRVLTWLQDVEFTVYGYLFQSGRNAWGTAGMGGNGQFNRLSALDDLSDHRGPWRDRLTEDQDLGLRLVAAGWKGRQDVRATVEQQGLARLRPLLRQRTRWSQGNLQAMGLVASLGRAPLPVLARVELLAYLLMPLWQGVVGAAFACAVLLAVLGVAPLWSDGPWWYLAVVHLLAFGGTVLGCAASLTRRAGLRGLALAVLIGHAYALYTWLIWPVLARSTVRQVLRRRQWAKTARHPVVAPVNPTPVGVDG